MNNGNLPNPSQHQLNELMQPVQSISPEQFNNNMSRIQALKEMLAVMEQNNVQALSMYMAEQEKQQLEAIAEQGRLAQQRLAQLNGMTSTSSPFAPPVAGPSTSSQSWHPSQYLATQPTSTYHEIPTSARIVEVPSSSQGPPQLHSTGHTSSNLRGNAPNMNTYQQAYTQYSVPSMQTSYGPSDPTAGSSTSPAGHLPTGWSATPPSAQQQQYSGAYRTADGQNHGVSTPNPDHQRATVNHYRDTARQPSANTSGQPSSAHYRPRPGPGASAPAGRSSKTANSSASSTAQSSSNAVYPNGVSTAQKAQGEAASQQQPGAPSPMPVLDVGLLIELFKTIPIKAIQQMMMLTYVAIDKLKTRTQMTSADWEFYGPISTKGRHLVAMLAQRMKDLPTTQTRDMFGRVYSRVAQKQAELQGAQQQPLSEANPVHVHSSSTAQSSIPKTHPINPPPSQPPTARPVPSIPNTSTNGTPAYTGQVQWYKPHDPNAPWAFRNSDGRLQFIFQTGSQQASASTAPASQTVLSTPTRPPLQTQSQTSTPPTEQRSKSPWSPQKADRRRLAQDIIRSLGPPKGAFGTPLDPLTIPSSEVIESPTESGKRKTSPASSPRPATPSKRRRVGDDESIAAQPDASVSVETKAEQTDVVVQPLPPAPVSDRDIIDLTMEEPAAGAGLDGPVDLEQIDPSETIPVRTPSVISSDAVDAHQVQETIVGAALDSSPTPSSPAIRKSKSPSLGATLEEINRLHPSQDLDYTEDAFDLPEETIALLSPPRPLQPSPSQGAPSSPSTVPAARAQKEKLPLFLPSRSSSPELGFSHQASPPPPTEDDDVSVASSKLKLFDFKGKGKARQGDTDVEMASSRDGDESPRRIRTPRRSMAYVLAPPLPAYAKGRRSPRRTASPDARESSVDELAISAVDEDRDEEMSEEGKESLAAAELSYSRLRETPCQWSGCGAILNSTHTLQKHFALHAGEQDEWGSYACRWHRCLANRFVDKVGLLKHLNKHALTPLRCAYEGCDQLFDAPDKLLIHHQSSKHRTLRAYCEPFLPAERRQLPPLPDLVPAYLSVPCRVSMHPLSKERHQWLGGKVLENIICFKWQGRRSNAAAPSRESRRLAEKMAASELAGKTPAESLALIKRWIDGEYLDLTDGYDASRRHHLHCDQMGSGEVTKMVNDGLVLFSNEPEPLPATAPPAPSVPPAHPEHSGAFDSNLGPAPTSILQSISGETEAREAAGSVSVAGATEASHSAAASGDPSGPRDREDQLADDVKSPDGKANIAGGGRLELPRRSNIRALARADEFSVGGNAVAEPRSAPDAYGGSSQLPQSTEQQETETEAEER